MAAKERLCRGEVPVFGDQWPHPVRGGAVSDLLVIDGEPGAKAGGEHILVGGVGAGTAAFGLPEALDGSVST
jgi:hypothetical protein